MKQEVNFGKDLMQFLDKSPCSFFAVQEMKKRLEEKGYQELLEQDAWKLKKNGKYYVTKNDSAIFAFQLGNGEIEKEGFHIIGSHSDSPCFRVKNNPEMVVEGKYLKLNTEVYGGPILSTWFDRALSLAGRVTVRGKDSLHPVSHFVNIDEDFMTIPNLCIHMNRGVNDGMSWNAQKDTLPFLGTLSKEMEAEGYLQTKIAKMLKKKPEDILAMDLFVYDREKAKIIGMKQEFIQFAPLFSGLAEDERNALDENFAQNQLTANAPIFSAGNTADGLYLVGKGTPEECRAMAEQSIADGSALETFCTMVRAQGGDDSVLRDYTKFQQAPYRAEIKAERSGFITKMNAEEIGETSVVLGAGRETKESAIDFSAGLILHKKYGDEVKEGDSLVTLYTSKESALADAEKMYREAIAIGDEQPVKEPLVYARVEKDKVEKY